MADELFYHQAIQGNMLVAMSNMLDHIGNPRMNCPGLPAEVNVSGIIVVKASVNPALDDVAFSFLQNVLSANMNDLRFENGPFLCTSIKEQDIFTSLSLSYTVVSAVLSVLTILFKLYNGKCNKLQSTSVVPTQFERVLPVESKITPLTSNSTRSWTETSRPLNA